MSQNARRHGAQSAPDKSLLLVHLKHILGYEPTSEDLQTPTLKLKAAVQLAACEARLDEVHAHYAKAQEVDRYADFDELMEGLEDLLYHDKLRQSDKVATLFRILRMEWAAKHYANWDKRLANRYLREAHNQRKRALQVYMKYVFTETEK